MEKFEIVIFMGRHKRMERQAATRWKDNSL